MKKEEGIHCLLERLRAAHLLYISWGTPELVLELLFDISRGYWPKTLAIALHCKNWRVGLISREIYLYFKGYQKDSNLLFPRIHWKRKGKGEIELFSLYNRETYFYLLLKYKESHEFNDLGKTKQNTNIDSCFETRILVETLCIITNSNVHRE